MYWYITQFVSPIKSCLLAALSFRDNELLLFRENDKLSLHSCYTLNIVKIIISYFYATPYYFWMKI